MAIVCPARPTALRRCSNQSLDGSRLDCVVEQRTGSSLEVRTLDIIVIANGYCNCYDQQQPQSQQQQQLYLHAMKAPEGGCAVTLRTRCSYPKIRCCAKFFGVHPHSRNCFACKVENYKSKRESCTCVRSLVQHCVCVPVATRIWLQCQVAAGRVLTSHGRTHILSLQHLNRFTFVLLCMERGRRRTPHPECCTVFKSLTCSCPSGKCEHRCVALQNNANPCI